MRSTRSTKSSPRLPSPFPATLARRAGRTRARGLIGNVYYWDSLDALRQLIDHPAHLQAKQQQGQWLNGYQVTIAQVLKSLCDGGIVRLLATTEGGACAARVSPAVDR